MKVIYIMAPENDRISEISDLRLLNSTILQLFNSAGSDNIQPINLCQAP